MNWLAILARKLAGFFIDDAFLGVGTVLSVIAAALCRAVLNGRPLVAGALLAGGCLLALTLSVAKAAAAAQARESELTRM